MSRAHYVINHQTKQYLNPSSLPVSNRMPKMIMDPLVARSFIALMASAPADSWQQKQYTQIWFGAWHGTQPEIINDVVHEDTYRMMFQDYEDISYVTVAMLCELEPDVLTYYRDEAKANTRFLVQYAAPVALLENNVLQYELDTIFGGREIWKQSYYTLLR